MKYIVYIVISIVLLLGLTYFLLIKGIVRLNYPSKSKYPIVGVDVSHHQGKIDWQKIAKQDIKFAFVKATEGKSFKDKRFDENVKNAISNGIDVGAYHFFTFSKSGRVQFENLYSSIKDKELTLPPVLDLEFGGNGKLNKSVTEVLAEIDTMQSLLEEALGCKPIFYLTSGFINHFYKEQTINNPIWIRGIFKEPKYVKGEDWLFWQFANKGKLDGVKTFIDLNVFSGTEEDYSSFIRSLKMSKPLKFVDSIKVVE